MRVAVVGLGYVGLPVALAFARKFPGTVGFDIDDAKIQELRRAEDRNGEVDPAILKATTLKFTSQLEDLRRASFFVVAVPTPVDKNNVPDLTPVLRATETVGKAMQKGSTVVYESTVYPGVTEDICAPLLAKTSGLKRHVDFKVGYSPERINPGDKEHTLERITKVVSGEDAATLEQVASAYGAIIDAGVHKAPCIKVAEAAKVIENTQRDINIALMNELALIFDRMGVRTSDVLAAAGTKWNFLKFRPGLVGGHCIGVDPYYLTTKAQELGYQPEVILSGRRINNSMGPYIAQRLVKLMVNADIPAKGARVGILGLTFKENCSDLRNSRVPDIFRELGEFGIAALVHDPLASSEAAKHEYDITLSPIHDFRALDALILAVSHDEYRTLGADKLGATVREGGIIMDIKSLLDPAAIPGKRLYWSL
jgi:UDP-N-acetyl-D-glucosamine/UDP-N-acetyl-D-galactosamine dehydrogenase